LPAERSGVSIEPCPFVLFCFSSNLRRGHGAAGDRRTDNADRRRGDSAATARRSTSRS
jgi:hypothetical protein